MDVRVVERIREHAVGTRRCHGVGDHDHDKCGGADQPHHRSVGQRRTRSGSWFRQFGCIAHYFHQHPPAVGSRKCDRCDVRSQFGCEGRDRTYGRRMADDASLRARLRAARTTRGRPVTGWPRRPCAPRWAPSTTRRRCASRDRPTTATAAWVRWDSAWPRCLDERCRTTRSPPSSATRSRSGSPRRSSTRDRDSPSAPLNSRRGRGARAPARRLMPPRPAGGPSGSACSDTIRGSWGNSTVR